MPPQVAIYGSGIAACCCARLLQRRGFHVSVDPHTPASSPTLLINPSTQKLLADVFEAGGDLFSGLPVIRKRMVLWGDQSPLALPHSGVVVNESALLARLWNKVRLPSIHAHAEPDFAIHSTSRHALGIQQHFGSRIAHAVPVHMKETASDACWIESLQAGWLFLLPAGEHNGSLISIGEPPSNLLAQSRLVAPQIDSLVGSAAEFPAYPRVLDPLCAPRWLACGSAAMSFDPICGEGAGNAVREAILASAVVMENLASPLHPDRVLSHYSSRLLHGFLRHLDVCRRFYFSGRRTAWWDAELASLERGIAWAESRLSALPEPQFRLVGFHLQPLA